MFVKHLQDYLEKFTEGPGGSKGNAVSNARVYIMDEKGDDIFDLAKEKLMTFVSFWYFSQNPTEEDFDSLEKDIEEGNI